MTPELTNALYCFRLAFLCKPIVSITDLLFLKAWVNRYEGTHPQLTVLGARLHAATTDAEVVSILTEFAPAPAPRMAFHALLGVLYNHPKNRPEWVCSYIAILEILPEIPEEYPETFYLTHYPYKRDLQIYYQDLDDAMDVEPVRVGETLQRFTYFLGVFKHFRWDNFEDWNRHHSHVQQRINYLLKKGKATGYYMADPQDLWGLDENKVYDLKSLERLVYESQQMVALHDLQDLDQKPLEQPVQKEFNPIQPTHSDFPSTQENKPSISPFIAFWKGLFGKRK